MISCFILIKMLLHQATCGVDMILAFIYRVKKLIACIVQIQSYYNFMFPDYYKDDNSAYTGFCVFL